MSGIAGIIHFDGSPVECGQIQQMTNSLAHRGPDGISHWSKGPAAFGLCMLHTTPESLLDKQPLTNEDESLVLIMDGRVDNWEQLRKTLIAKNIKLRNRTDSELVLKSFEHWGKDCLNYIDGDFALAIWNDKRKEIFCARDRMGNKPFNYFWNHKTLVFASELHSILLLPCVPQDLNKGVLAEYLSADWYSRDETLWKDIYRIKAAHNLLVNSKALKIERYWAPDFSNYSPYKNDSDYIEHYLELFTNIVKQLSRSNKPLGIEVSGGLDSSAIFAIANNLDQSSALLAPNFNGYTLDFHDDPDANELEYCRAVGNKTNKIIPEITPSTMPLSWYRDNAQQYKEIPQFPNGVMSLDLMKSAKSDGCSVLLNGIGGDEWLGGSRLYYAEELASGNWKQLKNCFVSDLKSARPINSLWWLLRFGFIPLLPESIKNILRDFNQNKHQQSTWLTLELKNLLKKQYPKNYYSLFEEKMTVGQRSKLHFLSDAYSIRSHEAQERLAAQQGLELRRPYWNHKLVQFSLDMPQRLKHKHGINRFTHRQAMKGLLPELVLNRQTKAEFSVTYRHHLPKMKDLLTKEIPLRRSKWVNQKEAEFLFLQAQHDGTSMAMLWSLFGSDSLDKS